MPYIGGMAGSTRERMISTTARLLQQRGYHGASLNDILSESGAPRGSLYFHFPGGKDELVIEATRATVSEATAQLRQTLAAAKNPARGVRTFFEDTARIMSESGFKFGCPVAPLILDEAGGVRKVEEICREAFDEWTGLFQQAFVRSGIPPRRAETLSLLVESAMEGLMLIARAYRDVTPMMRVAKELEAAIDAALPASKGARERSPHRIAPKRDKRSIG